MATPAGPGPYHSSDVLGRIVLLVTLLAAGLAAACGRHSAGAAPAGDPAPAGPLSIELGARPARMLLTGALAAEDAVSLIAPNVSIWPLQVRWVVEDGTEVAAGDPVVELDNSQLVSRLAEQRAQALAAASRLDATAARVAGELAGVELERVRAEAALAKARLAAELPPGLLAEQEVEERRKELRRAELELGEAEAKATAKRTGGAAEVEIDRVTLETALAAVERAESGVALLILRAPRAGVVVLGNDPQEGRPIRAGDNVWPGLTLARLPDLATLMVEASLFDVDDGAVVPGLAVTATLDAFPERTFAGRVEKVEASAREVSRRSRRRAFVVLIRLDAPDPALMRPGMSVKVEVATPDPRSPR